VRFALVALLGKGPLTVADLQTLAGSPTAKPKSTAAAAANR